MIGKNINDVPGPGSAWRQDIPSSKINGRIPIGTVTTGGAVITGVAGATFVGGAVITTGAIGYGVGNIIGGVEVGGQTIHDHLADGIIAGLDKLGLW